MLQSVVTAIGTLIIIVAILFLTYICTKYIGNRMNAGGYGYAGQKARYISLMDRMMVGQESSVALVKISGRVFLLGITGDNVNLLMELKEDELTEIPAPVNGNYTGTAFKDVIERLKDRKK